MQTESEREKKTTNNPMHWESAASFCYRHSNWFGLDWSWCDLNVVVLSFSYSIVMISVYRIVSAVYNIFSQLRLITEIQFCFAVSPSPSPSFAMR